MTSLPSPIGRLVPPALARWCAGGLMATALSLAAPQVPTIRASIHERPGAAPGETALTVRLTAVDLTLGSYQGALHFAPGSLGIISATTPRGDGTRMVNLADSAKGVIRFAGFTVSGFTSDEVMTVIVRAAKGVAAANLTAVPDVAGDLNGISVPRDRLIPARGVAPDSARD